MFSKILIANRGEIACRIIRTARRMGIATVAVFSEADRDALHVREADEALAIGPAPASESYLDIEHMVEAARRSGAEAVHPGYGFLSERAAFVQALSAAGIVFIGPGAAAIEAMGDKIESKRLAAAAGVPVLPGSPGAVADLAEAERAARSIGYPVMLKASAGGGGKGMRVVTDAGALPRHFNNARDEALSAFGDGRLFVERFIENPRHIEIQILADQHGNVVHLGDRECSIQRRNQKVIEEAPSLLLDEAARNALGERAKALARAVGYVSAGTVEFVADQDGGCAFLEMNTRLQVEHPVTEAVTGLDLVEQMIRIAAGEPLGFTQGDLRIHGWAIESRIYAEVPESGFLPATGRLRRFGSGPGSEARLDTGVEDGDSVGSFYDPLLAKLVTHGPDRASAVERMQAALDGFRHDGVPDNVAFLSAIMASRRWREGRLSIGFIAEEFGARFTPQEPRGPRLASFVAIAVAIDRLRHGASEDRGVLMGAERHDVRVISAPAGLLMEITSRHSTVTRRLNGGLTPDGGHWIGTIDGAAATVAVSCRDGMIRLSQGGEAASFAVLDPAHATLWARMAQEDPAAAASGVILAPMTGVLQAMLVEVGSVVGPGTPVAVIEAMKMLATVSSEVAGTVLSIEAMPGAPIELGAALVRLAPP